ncbi:MAG: AEC family transporter [Burkholderiaceae bacterium]
MPSDTNLLQAIFPVFALLAAGYGVKRVGWMQPAYADGLNRFVYYLAFPALLFIVIARTPRTEIFKAEFLSAWIVALLVGYFLASMTSLLWQRDGLAAMGVRGFNTSCGNTSMVGIPLCVSAFGKDAALLAVLATIANAVVGVSMTVLFIESSRQVAASRIGMVVNIAWSLAKNPLMIGFLLGFACAVWYGPPPPAVANLCDILGGAAIPCSLVATGLFFAGHTHRIAYSQASVFTFLKLIVQPLLGWVIAHYLFGIEGWLLSVLVVLSAMPLASTCFVIAQRFEVLAEETSSMMIISTIVSLITLSVLLGGILI